MQIENFPFITTGAAFQALKLSEQDGLAVKTTRVVAIAYYIFSGVLFQTLTMDLVLLFPLLAIRSIEWLSTRVQISFSHL